MPEAQVSPVAQSLSAAHVHWTAWCVAVHLALGPHWLSEEQVSHLPPSQTWPAEHWPFTVQVGQSLVHGMQPVYCVQLPWSQ
jgi:hypothetical protein